MSWDLSAWDEVSAKDMFGVPLDNNTRVTSEKVNIYDTLLEMMLG